MIITDIIDLKHGCPYRVVGGDKDCSIFIYSYGYKRFVPSMDVYYHTHTDNDLLDITPYLELKIPKGAPVPCNGGLTISLEGDDADAIREALSSGFIGAGYEIGAGDRPTRLPLSTRVTYIDKFTFDEASNGSFIGKNNKGFVHVSLFEEMEYLGGVDDESSDFFIACHVIEHVKNVIGSIKSVLKKLKKGGCLFLVVPDKRYIFDRWRPETTLEHFLADEIRGADADNLEHYIEYFRRSALDSNFTKTALASVKSGRDIHMHVFTPVSMGDLLNYLRDESFFSDYSILTPQQSRVLQEFYVQIIK